MNELSLPSGLLALTFGVVVGSFVNVLIHRLPLMVMQAQEAAPESEVGLDICQPASHCPNCHTPLRAWHLLPLLSYVWLKGRCNFCQHPIGVIYPLIETVTGLLWLACAWRWGLTPSALSWACFATSLLALSVIDWQTTLLPDALTQTLLWTGLIASSMRWIALPLDEAVWGAAVGYTSLWLVAFVFEQITHQEGMGAGDFKLFAALGAWLGPMPLIPLVFLASMSGMLVGIALKARGQLHEGRYVPFGPFLAMAAGLLVVFGPNTALQWLSW